MAKVKLEDFPIEKLRKRKKIALILFVILIVAALLDLTVFIYDLIIKNGFNISLFVTATACFVISLPIYLGKKKIEEILKNREKI